MIRSEKGECSGRLERSGTGSLQADKSVQGQRAELNLLKVRMQQFESTLQKWISDWRQNTNRPAVNVWSKRAGAVRGRERSRPFPTVPEHMKPARFVYFSNAIGAAKRLSGIPKALTR